MTNRRPSCFSSILSSLLALAFSGTVAASSPNFVLLMGDDHGWYETGYNGHPWVKTPVLDEMARSGLKINRFYSGHPSCSPTRGSFLTGRHPNRYGTFQPGWSIRPEEITIAQLLSEAGYRCGHFGKWHLGPVKEDSPTNPAAMGFHEFVSHDNFYEMDPVFSRNGATPQKYPGEGSEVTIEQTIQFIDRAVQKDQPFLAVVWFGSPHEPYSGLEKDLALYDSLPEDLRDHSVRLTSMETGRPTTRPLRDVLRERYAEITAMDRAIGTLRDHLSSKGIRDNTVVWYCGDNGSPSSAGRFATPFRGEKGQVFEGGIRVPGIIEWPARIPTARETSFNSVTSDILPTLCDLANVAHPERPIDGVSLAPVIDEGQDRRGSPICFWLFDSGRVTGKDSKAEPYIAPKLQEGTTPLVKYMGTKLTRDFRNFHYPPIVESDYRGSRAIVADRYKLVVSQRRGDEPKLELFDIREDPAESSNLSESLPSVVKELSEELKAWQDSVLTSLREADYAPVKKRID